MREDDRMTGPVWLDGKFIEMESAQVDLLTHSLHYASAVFEGIRVYEYVPFELKAHLERLLNSARLLGYTIPYTVKELESATLELIKMRDLQNGYIRPLAYLGS